MSFKPGDVVNIPSVLTLTNEPYDMRGTIPQVSLTMWPSFIVNGIMGVFQNIPAIMERTR